MIMLFDSCSEDSRDLSYLYSWATIFKDAAAFESATLEVTQIQYGASIKSQDHGTEVEENCQLVCRCPVWDE